MKYISAYISVAVFFCAFAVCFLLTPLAANAEISSSYDHKLLLKKASSVGEVGAAFLKLTNNYPDFNVIVESYPEYRKSNALARAAFKEKEVQKLQNAFVGFSAGKTPLIVRAGVKINFKLSVDGTAVLDFYPPEKGQLYFPFVFAKYPIALIINDIEIFQSIALTKEESKMAQRKLPTSWNATLLLELLPLAADDKTPIVLDNISQYPMLSEISYIALLNDQGEQIWGLASSKHGSYTPLPDLVAKPMLGGAPIQ